MARISVEAAGGQNVVAFLDMIGASEIGAPLLKASDDGYNVLVGSTPARPLLFPSYATHPNVLNPALNSTAAGRYQLLHHWYVAYAQLLHLGDFSPLSQDLIALQQIRERKAIPLILDGQITAAIYACSNIWASLPGNSYGQHQNAVSMLVSAYRAAGGMVALA